MPLGLPLSQKTTAQAKSQLSCLVSRVARMEGTQIFMIGLDSKKCQAVSHPTSLRHVSIGGIC